MHVFGHNVSHDYYFELLREEERDTPIQLPNSARTNSSASFRL